MSRLFRPSLLATAVLLASCSSVQRVDEAAGRATLQGQEASSYAAVLRNQQAEPKRDTVVFSDKPWVSTQPLVARRGLPTATDCELVYRPSGSVGLTEIAGYITSQCGMPVLISPDALAPSVYSGGAGMAAMAGGSPDSLAGLLPVGVISGAGATAGATTTPPAASRPLDATTLASIGKVSGLAYSGRLSGLLDEVTARLGLAWRYSPAERAVRISYYDTRVFDVYAFGDDQVIESTVRSGMNTSAGVGSGTSGGTGGSSNSGVSGESGSSQSTTVRLKSSILADIQNNVKAMLSTAPAGRLFLSTSTGTLTVTDRPEVLDRVQAYLDSTNRSISQQVLFNVKVFEVTLNDTDQLGVNWAAVYRSLSNKWNLSLANVVPGISTSAISGSVGIVNTSSSALAGSNVIIQALAEQGRVSNVRSPSVTTLNLQPAPLQIGNVKGYVAASSTTNTASVGSSTALTPGTITSGFNMTLLPRVMDHDELMLMISINMSSKPTFQTFTSNSSSIQVPDYDAKSLSPKVKLKSGQTLILSGFDELSEDTNKVGVGEPGFFGLGGGRTRTSTHSVLVVLITPILMG
ncbi:MULTISPECIES: PilN family type IVB pilus formation outer membrane protein [unclassified Pseudomonas]|uniref:PilN family type IVB pilus formation outer membrane protein n=1 Tax=unclassified Pseudomonas TaxID=196821 RepID=UPI0023602089|nr:MULTISPECIES: PilN family type IVB pilus formation outer membrane protein [unclassified Pseudomonas]